VSELNIKQSSLVRWKISMLI